MPTAVCDSCGRSMTWRNMRGHKLSDYRCPDCGGTVSAAVYDPEQGKWVKRTAKKQKAMGPVVACVLCGRRGRLHGPIFPRSREGLRLSEYTKLRTGKDSVPDNEPACWFHFERVSD